MISAPFAHVGGIPIEETLGSFGPALFVGLGVAWANFAPASAGALSRQRAALSPRGNEEGARPDGSRDRRTRRGGANDQRATPMQATAPDRREGAGRWL